MVREDLVDYIKKAEDRGLSVEQVKKILLKAGHKEEEVELAILETHKRSRVGRTMGFHPAILYFFIIPVIIVVVVVGFANWYGNGDVDGGVVEVKTGSESFSMEDISVYDLAVEQGKPYKCRGIESLSLKEKCFNTIVPNTPFIDQTGMLPEEVTAIAIDKNDIDICEQIVDVQERISCMTILYDMAAA